MTLKSKHHSLLNNNPGTIERDLGTEVRNKVNDNELKSEANTKRNKESIENSIEKGEGYLYNTLED
ncbi:hypothetical protein [Clostridium sp. UBA7503]|uniref:hypothetical protein n=1 Tax=Clostridium sp. UBA7503 TaxID=1946377 RepID=UPI003217CE0C